MPYKIKCKDFDKIYIYSISKENKYKENLRNKQGFTIYAWLISSGNLLP